VPPTPQCHGPIPRTSTLCQSPLGSCRPNPLKAGPQLLFQSRRADIPTARQRADHHPLRSIQLWYKWPRHMPQPARHPMPLHRRTHRSRDDEANLRPFRRLAAPAPRINNKVWLHGSRAVLNRRIEIGRPRHAVSRGKHRCDTRYRIKQSASDVPCDADSTRSPAPPGCASAAGSRARGLAAGCSAGRSACP
jgi:hypothetical protein